MSNVSFTVGGRRFTVACASGEEAHVAELGRTIDARVAALGGLGGQSETRMLLFAALMLADEVHEQRAPAAHPVPLEIPPPDTAQADDDLVGADLAGGDLAGDDLAERLLGIAESLENLAARLEGEPLDV